MGSDPSFRGEAGPAARGWGRRVQSGQRPVPRAPSAAGVGVAVGVGTATGGPPRPDLDRPRLTRVWGGRRDTILSDFVQSHGGVASHAQKFP